MIVSILFVAFLIVCSFNKIMFWFGDKLVEGWITDKNRFNGVDEYVNKSLFLFFPYENSSLWSRTMCVNACINIDSLGVSRKRSLLLPMYVFEVYKTSDENEYYAVKERYNHYSVPSVCSNDTSAYVVFDPLLKESNERYMSEIDEYKIAPGEVHVIPKLLLLGNEGVENEVVDTSSLSGVRNDTELIFLLEGNRNLLRVKLEQPALQNIPRKYRHGFSSGVGFNDGILCVYYWALAW